MAQSQATAPVAMEPAVPVAMVASVVLVATLKVAYPLEQAQGSKWVPGSASTSTKPKMADPVARVAMADPVLVASGSAATLQIQEFSTRMKWS